jgi:hypothetical protein
MQWPAQAAPEFSPSSARIPGTGARRAEVLSVDQHSKARFCECKRAMRAAARERRLLRLSFSPSLKTVSSGVYF